MRVCGLEGSANGDKVDGEVQKVLRSTDGSKVSFPTGSMPSSERIGAGIS